MQFDDELLMRLHAAKRLVFFTGAGASTESVVAEMRSEHINKNNVIEEVRLFGAPQWNTPQQLLTIDVGALSGSMAKVRMTGWHQGIDVSLFIEGKLEQRGPFAASLFPIEFFEQPLLRDWAQTIPVSVLTLLHCYAINPLGFLQIISRDCPACQLFLDHPVLFVLLYQQTQKEQLGLSWFLTQCRLKRTQVLQACGLPAYPLVVKLLKKLVFKRYYTWHTKLLLTLLKLDYAALNHVPSISETLLHYLIQFPSLLNCQLIKHWRDEEARTLLGIVWDIQRMERHRYISTKQLFEPVQHCRNSAEITRVHDRLAELINTQKPGKILENLAFPAPPLIGNADIIPITSYAELVAEGRQQQHCVVSYSEDIVSGHYYVYRVLAPERATLGVSILPKRSGQDIALDQLKGLKNCKVSVETQQSVETWFISHQRGKMR